MKKEAKTKEKSTVKRVLKVVGIILLVIVVIVAVLAVWNWKYVKALLDGMMNDETQLAERQLQQTEKNISEVNSYMESELRDMTQEEKDKMLAGELSQTEIMAKIISEATGIPLPDVSLTPAPGQDTEDDDRQTDVDTSGIESSSSGETAASGGDNTQADGTPSGNPNQAASSESQTSNPQTANSDQLVANAVNKLYVLQGEYTSQLAGLVSRAQSYYSEQWRTNGSAAAKTNTVSKFSGEVASMEGACDAKVEAVLGELTSQLNSIGADTSIVGTLRAAYNNEKASQRAAYVNKYMK